MNRFHSFLVWLRRIGHCRGFGIQSPNDYRLVRYVINEHWPYYQYDTLGLDDNWQRKKLGKLYFRLANWRQPSVITTDDYQDYFAAGCRKAIFGEAAELVRISMESDCWQQQLYDLYNKVDEHTILIAEAIWKNKEAWRIITTDERTGVTFDLYYCGIVLFEKKRTRINYIINF